MLSIKSNGYHNQCWIKTCDKYAVQGQGKFLTDKILK